MYISDKMNKRFLQTNVILFANVFLFLNNLDLTYENMRFCLLFILPLIIDGRYDNWHIR